jgi:hypothetical protein
VRFHFLTGGSAAGPFPVAAKALRLLSVFSPTRQRFVPQRQGRSVQLRGVAPVRVLAVLI